MLDAGLKSLHYCIINHRLLEIDGFVQSLKTSFGVIPTKAGIQCFQIVLDACLRRQDGFQTFYEFVKVERVSQDCIL
jgi:hypothetical protein